MLNVERGYRERTDALDTASTRPIGRSVKRNTTVGDRLLLQPSLSTAVKFLFQNKNNVANLRGYTLERKVTEERKRSGSTSRYILEWEQMMELIRFDEI